MKQFDLDSILDLTRDARASRLDVLFNGPRLVEAPPENLFVTSAPPVDGPVIAQQYGTKTVLVVAASQIPEPLRSWLLAVIPHRAPDDEDGVE